jgi:GNAT superfamily N-acetyltransferase
MREQSLVTGKSSSFSEIEIIEYQPRYARDFRDLNYEWLERYFEVEPYDRIVLNDPQNQVIKLGGYIFFARVGGQIVGTCALLKHTDKKYELAKMGVTERFQGRGIGRRLVQVAIETARALDAETLVLATSRLLPAANHLYESLGFGYVDNSVIGPLPYKRETIVMAVKL